MGSGGSGGRGRSSDATGSVPGATGEPVWVGRFRRVVECARAGDYCRQLSFSGRACVGAGAQAGGRGGGLRGDARGARRPRADAALRPGSQGGMLLVKVRTALKLAGEGEQAIFRKRRAAELKAGGQAVDEAAGDADGRKAAEIARLDEPGPNTFLLGTFGRRFVEGLAGGVGRAEARGRDQHVYVRKQVVERGLDLGAYPHRLQIVERGIVHGRFEAVDLALVGELIDGAAADKVFKDGSGFRIDDDAD